MKREIDPKETSRAFAFEAWTKSPQPMVTMMKTFDLTHLCRMARRRKMKMNMLLCWCIGKAASSVDEFYLLPEGGRLFRYDALSVNVIVKNRVGGLSSCDVPFCADLSRFAEDYDRLTEDAVATCSDFAMEENMAIGTSAMIETELDCIVNQYTGVFNNPFLSWGRVRRRFWKSRLPISFQFHHAQMDGGHAAAFLESLQHEMNRL